MTVDEGRVQGELLEAARDYFFKYGFSRVSTGEIASSVGRSKKTLYKYFSTKEQLLDAVLADLNREVEHDVLELIADRERQFADTAVEVLARVGVHVASVGQTLFTDLESKQPRKYRQIRDERRQLIVGFLRKLFDEGARRGEVRTDVDLERVIVMFLAGAETLAGPETVSSHAVDPAELYRELARTVVRGLRPD